MLVHARYLVNSFHVTLRVPSEILIAICSHLTTDEDVFSASQVCNHWRLVLTSSPSLWTRFSCRHDLRTIVSLERCKSIPIRLKFGPQSSIVALENVLLRENKVTSLAIHRYVGQMPTLHQLFVHSRPSVEQLHMFTEKWAAEEPTVHEIWQDLPSLRELFLCQYTIPIDHLVAPNLIHLGLEKGEHSATVKSTLDMLRGCPLLETLLIVHSNDYADQARDYSPVFLPHLRSIELGMYEVNSGLITYIQLPQNVAACFRELFTSYMCREITSLAMATIQHALRRVDIHCITLAAPLSPQQHVSRLVRFEGPGGSLEITTDCVDPARLQNTFFSPGGVLSSHSLRIGNVRELHIVGCSFNGDQGLGHISAAMPNLISISLFGCQEPHAFRLLTPTNPSSPPFPRLERVLVLGPGLGLREMAKARRDFCIPLKTLIIGRGPKGTRYDYPGDYSESALGEFVDNLHIGCPTKIVGWGTENEIVNVWSAIEVPGIVSPNGHFMILD